MASNLILRIKYNAIPATAAIEEAITYSVVPHPAPVSVAEGEV